MNFIINAYNFTVASVPLGRIAAGILVVLLALIARKVVTGIFRRGRKSGRDSLPFELLHELAQPAGSLVLLLGITLGLALVRPPDAVQVWTDRILNFALTCFVVWALFKSVDAIAFSMKSLATSTESRLDDQLLPVLQKLARIVVIALAIVFYLQVLGYPVTGIIAGLGIGGIAIALAAQDSLSGIFASVNIFLDRPFMVGDFVSVAGVSGTVEEIGLRSTRIRTPGKTLVTIPNKEIVNTDIDNLSLRPMRRVEMSIGLTYDTTARQMENLLQVLREYMPSNQDVDDGLVLVSFTGFGDWSLDIDLKFFLKTIDYNEFLQMRERINLNLMRIVGKFGLSMAFPTGTVITGSPLLSRGAIDPVSGSDYSDILEYGRYVDVR
jgi:MscS family membrane protein